MSETPRVERRETPEAKVHLARWSPWIWILPAAAIFFAGFLVVRYGLFGGGDITVRFADARGLDRYSPVRFRGAKVGSVQKITIDKNLRQVVVRISIDASMSHALNKGTHFWIVEPGLEGGGLGGLLSGTYVGVAPGEGEATRDFVGQEYEPVLSPPEDGKTFILEGRGVGAISVGSPVQYNGMHVGSILGAEYDAQRGVTYVHVFVTKRFADSVRQSTRFWRSAGLQFSLGGSGVAMASGGLQSVLLPPVAFYTPEVLPGPPVPEGTHFTLFDSEGAAIAAADGQHLTYVTYFTGPVRGLTRGTPVYMKGVQVGHVRDVRLRYVPQNASLETPVALEIDPSLLQIEVQNATSREQLRAEMNDALAKLVQKGLRATLNTSLVLPGASGVSLDFVAAPGTGRLVTSVDPPIIPAATASSGIDSALASLNDIAARIQKLPIEEIAGHLRSTTAQVDKLVHDPALSESLQRLNRSMGDIEKVAGTARENVGPIVESLRSAAASAQDAAARAQQMLSSAPRQDYDLGNLVKELTRASESVRGLADYLQQNPDALLKGRGKGK
ncbi:MAG TPA: MlaD family protein [Thermoanaerobaculia bacterium]|nr:MlaD family protein [Thermoanaerobaculia bacterium]